jgi:hypothetical protein
MVEVSG